MLLVTISGVAVWGNLSKARHRALIQVRGDGGLVLAGHLWHCHAHIWK